MRDIGHLRKLQRQSLSRSPRSRVYFAQEGAAGPIKIGTAVDVHARVKSFSTGNSSEVRLLAMLQGDRSVENLLHSIFSEAHLRGEWFRPTPSLLQFIADLPDLDAPELGPFIPEGPRLAEQIIEAGDISPLTVWHRDIALHLSREVVHDLLQKERHDLAKAVSAWQKQHVAHSECGGEYPVCSKAPRQITVSVVPAWCAACGLPNCVYASRYLSYRPIWW